MKTAAAYIRVSTDDQIEYSPNSQLKALRDYAKRNDMILPEKFVFVDEGISGRTTAKRPEFNRMIGLAKTKPKPFDVILLWKFSRFARNREDAIVYKSMLRKQLGIEVVSISENIGDDKMSVLIEAMIEAMDEYYSINLAEEVKRGMIEKVSRGEPVSIPSFGYDIKNKNYVPNPETAPIVKSIFEDFLNGGMGIREIAQKLNALGIRTSRGGLWENRTVEYILRNPVYIGKIRWNPAGRTRRNYNQTTIMLIDGHHEPIIDEVTFNAAQEKIDEIKNLYGKSTAKQNHSTKPFMLYGLVKCSNCGATLTRSISNSLQCYKYAHGKCNISHNISLKKLNGIVLDVLEQTFNGTIAPVYTERTQESDSSTNNTANLLASEKRKLERVKAAYEAGIDTLEEYRENKRKITEKIKLLENEQPKRKKSRTPLKQHLKIISQLQDPSMSEEDKNKLLRMIVDHIIFSRPDCSVQIFLR